MTTSPHAAHTLTTLLISLLLASALALGADAPQVTATARSATPDPAAEIKRLRSLVEALEHRVGELEKQRLEILKDQAAEATERAAEEAKAARVEQRLVTLEKARSAEQPRGGSPTEGAEREQPLTVVAPFVVKDRAGKTIMVVQERGHAGEAGSRGLYVYGVNQSGGALAHVGATSDSDSGRVYVAQVGAARPGVLLTYDQEDGPTLLMNRSGTGQVATLDNNGLVFFNASGTGRLATLNRNGLVLSNPSGKGRVATLDQKGFVFFNSSGYPIAEILSKEGRGLMLLNGADGSHRVEAGSLVSGKGYVLVNPWQARTDVSGDPSVLMGGKTP